MEYDLHFADGLDMFDPGGGTPPVPATPPRAPESMTEEEKLTRFAVLSATASELEAALGVNRSKDDA